MITVTTDKKRNLLTITFTDHVTGDHAARLSNDLQKKVSTLKKGFTVFADLSTLEHMDRDTRIPIGKAMDFLNKNGTSRVIRIIPDPKKDIGFNILSLFHYSPEVIILTHKSHQEAQKHLTVKKTAPKHSPRGDGRS